MFLSYLLNNYRENQIKVNEEVEIFKYDNDNSKFIIEELYDKDMNPIEIANKSDEIVYVKCNEFVKKDYMLRRLK